MAPALEPLDQFQVLWIIYCAEIDMLGMGVQSLSKLGDEDVNAL